MTPIVFPKVPEKGASDEEWTKYDKNLQEVITRYINDAIKKASDELAVVNNGVTSISDGSSPFTGNIKISNTSPSISFEDTTTSAYDFRIRADANVLYLDVDTGSDGTFETSNPISSVYTGTSNTNLDYPIGTTIIAMTNAAYDRNKSFPVGNHNSNVNQFCNDGYAACTELSGTWRWRGYMNTSHGIFCQVQRTE